MRGKILLIVGLGVGYVVGTKQGREGYEKLVSAAKRVWGDPRVQKTVSDARNVAKEKAPVVSAKVAEVADTVAAVAGRSSEGGSTEQNGGAKADG